MTEINLIQQYCCFNNQYSYTSGIAGGYLLGISTIIIICICIEIIIVINSKYDFKENCEESKKND